MGSAAPHARNVRRLFSENDQAKPDLFSRLACSTLLSKILEAIRLSGALLDRGPGCYARVSSNLMRLPDFRLIAATGIFARTF